MLVDAMSSFGAVPIDGAKTPFTALVGSSNKGLEGRAGACLRDRRNCLAARVRGQRVQP